MSSTSTIFHFNSGIATENVKMGACFDLDWTLVRPERTKFPKTSNDNIIMPNRINTLKNYIQKGYTIIIFTNQKLTKKEDIKFKYDRMFDISDKFTAEGIPLIIYMSTADDKYRKPNIGMWEECRRFYTKLSSAFYCGDAAGRKSDFSDSDLQFANNIGIKFYTPEEIFE